MRKIQKKFSEQRFLTLRIELDKTDPLVWRELVILDSLTFNQLHNAIQCAMGWESCHLHAFQFGRDLQIAPVANEDEWFPVESMDSSKTKLRDLISRTRQKFKYEYDFGDSWEHTIKVVKITPVFDDPPFRLTLLGGANACPPEDCGGVGGFSYFKEALADPEHPEHEEMLDWYGDNFDPLHFDLTQALLAVESIDPKRRKNTMKKTKRGSSPL